MLKLPEAVRSFNEKNSASSRVIGSTKVPVAFGVKVRETKITSPRLHVILEEEKHYDRQHW